MATLAVMKLDDPLDDNENQERIEQLLHKMQMQKPHEESKFPNQIVFGQSLEFVCCYMAFDRNSLVLAGSTLSQSQAQSQILCKLQKRREQIRIQCARQRIYPTAALCAV